MYNIIRTVLGRVVLIPLTIPISPVVVIVFFMMYESFDLFKIELCDFFYYIFTGKIRGCE